MLKIILNKRRFMRSRKPVQKSFKFPAPINNSILKTLIFLTLVKKTQVIIENNYS